MKEGLIKKDTKKKQKGLEDIFDTFDPVKQVFEIEGKEFKPTAEQLGVIFGLQRTKGVQEYDMRHPTPEVVAAQVVFYKTYLKGKKMMKKDVIDSLYATAEDVTKSDDFVKLLVLYLCIVVFFPCQGGDKLSKMFLKYIFAMDQVFGLLTHFVSKYEGEQGQSKPRFARWNTKVLAKKITDEGMTSLRQDLTGSFIDPLDESEQSLITPIEIHQANPHRIGKKMVIIRERDEDRELSPDRDAACYLEDLVALLHLRPKGERHRLLSVCKRRKASMEDSRPCDGKGSCNKKPAHLPSSEPIPNLLTQEFKGKESEDDEHHSSVKDLHGNNVHRESSSSYSEAHTTAQEMYDVTHAKRKVMMNPLRNVMALF
ncbi:hypothetical protein MKW94_018666, partial [Papaver nudicaule]|nr:hypothetical protein [Papaver nudicaule]